MQLIKRFILPVFTILVYAFSTASLYGQDKAKVKIITNAEDTLTSQTEITVTISAANNYIKSWKQVNGQTIIQSIPLGKCTISAASNSVNKSTYSFYLSKDTTIIFNFKNSAFELEGVTITQSKANKPAGVERVNITEIKKIPSLLGEPDALKALQFTPGVQTGGEGATGFFVRGGSMDQNLFLYDGTPLYNVSHMFGLLSVFNADVVSGVSLYKGSFPAQYGGRLSSVVDVESRDGNFEKRSVTGGIGLIASRLTFESPFAKDTSGKNAKGSILLSARRTYADFFTRMINSAKEKNVNYTPIPTYYLYDLNGKLSYFIKPGQKIYISFYTGNDFLKYYENNGLGYKTNWSNTALTIGTQLLLTEKLSLNANIFHTGFLYNITNETDVYDLTLHSQIKDIGARADFTYHFSKADQKNTLNFGGQILKQQFSPQNIFATANEIDLEYNKTSTIKANQSAIYAEYIFNYKWFAFTAGLRASAYTFNSATYINPEPRLSTNVTLAKNEKRSLAIKTAYTRMFQYVHLISNNMASFPTDVWYPVTEKIKPQQSDCISGGLYSTFGKNAFLASLEGYYKFMSHVVEYAEGADILMEPNFENNLVSGKGNSYGAELMLKKQKGRFTGALAYTLSWSKRQFDEKNFGRVYFASFDRRHNLNTTVSYEINERAEINLAWVFASGNAITLPTGRAELLNLFPYTGGIFPIYTDKNNYRTPPFHHLDVNFVWKLKPKHGEQNLSLGIYNLYSRRNPYFIYFPTIRDGNNAYRKAEQVSLLPLIPNITYNFKF